MSVLDRVLGFFGYTKAAPSSPPGFIRAMGRSERWDYDPDLSQTLAQADLYRVSTWIQVAISHVANTAAVVPFSVYERNGEKWDDVVNHPFELLLDKPNPMQSRSEFMTSAVTNYRITGNAPIFLNRSGPDVPPVEMWIMQPFKTRPIPDGNSYLRGYWYEVGGERIFLEPWEVCHIKSHNPRNPYWGLSPIEALQNVALGDLAMQEWNKNFFAEDNAKMQGALAFADNYTDDQWNLLKAQIKEQYGGTKNRAMMLLRGVKAGAVNYVQTGVTQKDMEFLGGRNANRDEIYEMYAPGLTSMLSASSNRAGSITGKDVFYELAVFPVLNAIAEKFNNDVMPVYGEQFAGEFDDIRIKDREIELKEQEAASKVMTIDEVRERFWELQALEDGRGKVLVVGESQGVAGGEVGQGSKDILGYHIEAGVVTKNEARADVGLSPIDDSEDERQRRIKAQLDLMTVAKNAGLPTEIAVSLAGLELTPQQMASIDAERQRQEELRKPAVSVERDEPKQLPAPKEDETKAAAVKVLESEDIEKWEDKALKRLKRGKSPACAFHSDHIAPEVAAWVADGLDHATTPDAVKGAFKIAHEDFSAQERELMDALGRVFAKWLKDIARAIANGDTPQLDALSKEYGTTLLVALDTVIDEAGELLIQELGAAFDIGDFMLRAREWASPYVSTVSKGFTDVTRQLVESVIRTYRDSPGMTRGQVEALLQGVFGERRAAAIAVTEITRAASQAVNEYQAIIRESGIEMVRVWRTNNDSLTCPICAPLNGLTEDEWAERFPHGAPAHPRCRCAISLIIRQMLNDLAEAA